MKVRHLIAALAAVLVVPPVLLILWVLISPPFQFKLGRGSCGDPSAPVRLTDEECRLRYERHIAERSKACAFPAPGAQDWVVLLNAAGNYNALSNLSIGGDDEAVRVASFDIEPGDTQLFLIAFSHDAMIWHFTGDTGRISKIVAFTDSTTPGEKMRSGVAGLARDRVVLDKAKGCIHDIRHVPTLQAIIGRPPNQTISAVGRSRLGLPSGQPSTASAILPTRPVSKTGPSAGVWREALRFYPGGIADLDQSSVISLLPVKPYDVLPSQAGIAQLIESGALEPGDFQRVRVFGNFTVVGQARVTGMNQTDEFTLPGSFKIVRKMRFPPQLSGAHSVRFILAKGVEMPDGDPGHSTVVSE